MERYLALVDSFRIPRIGRAALNDAYVLVVTDKRLLFFRRTKDSGARHGLIGNLATLAWPDFCLQRFSFSVASETPEQVAAKPGSISIPFEAVSGMVLKRSRQVGGRAAIWVHHRGPSGMRRTCRAVLNPYPDVAELESDGSTWARDVALTPEHVQATLQRKLPAALLARAALRL